MKKALLLSLLLPPILFGAQWEYYNAMRSTVSKTLDADFQKHERMFVTSPSYPGFMELLDGSVSRKFTDKHTLNTIDYQKAFDALSALSRESYSLVPMLYAYHMMRLSYGVKSKEFNKKYGTVFAESLSSRDVCEGHVWAGLIYEREHETLMMAKEKFAKAKSVCKDESLLKRAQLSYAKVKYLTEKKGKRTK